MTMCAALAANAGAAGDVPDGAIRRVALSAPGLIQAVSVPDVPLVFTAQVTAGGSGVGPDAAVTEALAKLDTILNATDSDRTKLLRLNVHLRDWSASGDVENALRRALRGAMPAITIVPSAVPAPDGLLALDAVAATDGAATTVRRGARFAILPAGGKCFVSGQAERGGTLREGVALTMKGLLATLGQLGLTPADVVQIRAFISPFSEQAKATAAIEAGFGTDPAPPIVLLEWQSDVPAEIELIASANRHSANPIQQLTFPPLAGVEASPRFSRVAMVAAGSPVIFIGAVNNSGVPVTVDRTWHGIFAELGSALFDARTSFRQLAKATYYFTNPGARQPLTDIRTVFYDPTRPPAASAVGLANHGQPPEFAAIDLIAVPVLR